MNPCHYSLEPALMNFIMPIHVSKANKQSLSNYRLVLPLYLCTRCLLIRDYKCYTYSCAYRGSGNTRLF